MSRIPPEEWFVQYLGVFKGYLTFTNGIAITQTSSEPLSVSVKLIAQLVFKPKFYELYPTWWSSWTSNFLCTQQFTKRFSVYSAIVLEMIYKNNWMDATSQWERRVTPFEPSHLSMRKIVSYFILLFDRRLIYSGQWSIYYAYYAVEFELIANCS